VRLPLAPWSPSDPPAERLVGDGAAHPQDAPRAADAETVD